MLPELEPDWLPEPVDREVEPVAPAPLVEDDPAPPAAPELVAPPPVEDEPLLAPDDPVDPDDPEPIDDSVPVTSMRCPLCAERSCDPASRM